MFRRTEVAGSGSDVAAAAPAAEVRRGLPNLTGDLRRSAVERRRASAPGPRLRPPPGRQLRGLGGGGARDGTPRARPPAGRYGDCSAELEISRRLLAQVPKGVDLSAVSDRVRDMLRLAADEATSMVDAAREEADRILAEARAEADARLRKAHEIKQLAAETADEMLDKARRDRAEAAATLERARAEAAELVRVAATERDRLTDEAAEAGSRLAAVQAEVDDLRRQRDEARVLLHRLTDQIGQALSLATGSAPDNFLLIDNRVESLPS